MTIQILEIVVYSHDHRKRVLPFYPGKMNIITGASKSGKSSLIDIVDYCFCSDECNVPEGPIRRCVSWFGLKLKIDSGTAFTARKVPGRHRNSSEECFVEIGNDVVSPEPEKLKQSTNTEGLKSLLTGWSGIQDHIHTPKDGQTRPPISAHVRHGLAYCFQPQDEIIRREQLFHRASDNFVAQAIKDTIPYFIGAVDDEYVSKLEQLRQLRTKLRSYERQIGELDSLRGEGNSKAATLLAQARVASLTSETATSYEETISLLKQIDSSTSAEEPSAMQDVPASTEFDRLTKIRDELLSDQRQLSDEIIAARSYQSDEQGFSREANEQRARLTSIGIFDSQDPLSSCPLCAQALSEDNQAPNIEEIKGELTEISNRLEEVSTVAPRFEKAIAELQSKLDLVNEKLRKNRAELEAVSAASERLRNVRDESAKRALIIGRISLYLESLPELLSTKDLDVKVRDLKAQIEKLEEQVSDEQIQDRIGSISSLIGKQMTEWAQNLELEHSEHPLRMDFKRLTIISDTADGPVPMKKMGSGENWVGYHLIGHLALHSWFSARNRPVPRFLFLDQPSQVYFPPEKDKDGSLDGIEENDRQAVKKMFRFIYDAVHNLDGDFQVIITEHADLMEDWYQDSVAERWRGGLKLVPEDWPRDK